MRASSLVLLAVLAAGAPALAERDPGCVPYAGAVALAPLTGTGNGAPWDATGFQPRCVVVAPGTEVTWTNLDARLHDPSSFGDAGACFRHTLDVGDRMRPGASYTVRFDRDGDRLVAAGVDRVGECALARPDPDTGDLVLEYYSAPLSTTSRARLVVTAP